MGVTMFIDENSKPKEKLKAWYLFTEDFIAGTSHLSNEEIGIYMRLLCWNWNKRCIGLRLPYSKRFEGFQKKMPCIWFLSFTGLAPQHSNRKHVHAVFRYTYTPTFII